MAEILRDSPLGHIIRFVSSDKLLAHDDEGRKFEATLRADEFTDLEKTNSNVLSATRTKDGIALVGWYTSGKSISRRVSMQLLICVDDPENPQNWTAVKQYSVGALIWCVQSTL
jgi:hypothetical protein